MSLYDKYWFWHILNYLMIPEPLLLLMPFLMPELLLH